MFFHVRWLFCFTFWRITVGAKNGNSVGSSGLFSSWNDPNSNAKRVDDDADYYVSEQDLSRASPSRKKTSGSFSGSSFPSASSSSSTMDSEAEKRQKRMKAMQQREYDFDDRHDYSSEYRNSRSQDSQRPAVGTGKRSNKQSSPSVTVDVDRGALSGLYGLTKHLPRVNLRIDPVINFKLKQKITTYFGACITLGMVWYDFHSSLNLCHLHHTRP